MFSHWGKFGCMTNDNVSVMCLLSPMYEWQWHPMQARCLVELESTWGRHGVLPSVRLVLWWLKCWYWRKLSKPSHWVHGDELFCRTRVCKKRCVIQMVQPSHRRGIYENCEGQHRVWDPQLHEQLHRQARGHMLLLAWRGASHHCEVRKQLRGDAEIMGHHSCSIQLLCRTQLLIYPRCSACARMVTQEFNWRRGLTRLVCIQWTVDGVAIRQDGIQQSWCSGCRGE